MDDHKGFFSVYREGRNCGKRRQEGLKLLRASIKLTKASLRLADVALASGLTLAALWAVQRALAGAQFVIQRFTN
jgi:hypothetical protein